MFKKSLFLLAPFGAIFAQDGGPNPTAGLTQTFVMIGIALVFFYFILWRPEQKRRKAAEQMRSALKKGDRVTAMGIIGKVDKVQDQTVIVKMVDNSKIEFLKGAITDVQPASEQPSSDS